MKKEKIIKNSYGEDMYIQQYYNNQLISSHFVYKNEIRHLSVKHEWMEVFLNNRKKIMQRLQEVIVSLKKEGKNPQDEWVHTHFVELTEKYPDKKGTIYIEINEELQSNALIFRGRDDFADIFYVKQEFSMTKQDKQEMINEMKGNSIIVDADWLEKYDKETLEFIMDSEYCDFERVVSVMLNLNNLL